MTLSAGWATKEFPFAARLEQSDAAGYGPAGGFAGYASVYGVVDSEGDVIARGAFGQHLQSFLERGVVLYQHSTREPIGKPLEAREDNQGLWIQARLVDVSRARECRTLMQEGVITGLSVGFFIEGYEVPSDEQWVGLLGADTYWQARKGLPWWADEMRLLTQVRLVEVSPVTFPANPAARVTDVRSERRQPGSQAQFEAQLRQSGWSADLAAALAREGYPGLVRRRAARPAEYPELEQALADCRRAITGGV